MPLNLRLASVAPPDLGGRRIERMLVVLCVASCWAAFVVVPVGRSIPLEHRGSLSADALLPGIAWTVLVGLVGWYLGRLPGRRPWPWLVGSAGLVLLTGSLSLLPFEFAIGEAEGSTWTAFFPMIGVGLLFLVAASAATVVGRGGWRPGMGASSRER